MFISFIRNEEGATAIEYGLVAAIISLAGVLIMRSIGTQVSETFYYAGSGMQN